MGEVEPIPRPDFLGAFARASPPVEGCARLFDLPESLELLPIQFEDKRVESTARLRALGAVRDDDGNLIGGGRSGKLLGQKTAGIPGAHRMAGRGSVVE